MNNLQEFLLADKITERKEQINLGGRLEKYPLTIRSLTTDEYHSIRTMALENPNSNKKRRFNINKFNDNVVISCLVDPNLKDAEMLKAANLMDSIQLLHKVFLPGEIDIISEKILEASGFNTDMEEDIDEVKNF